MNFETHYHSLCDSQLQTRRDSFQYDPTINIIIDVESAHNRIANFSFCMQFAFINSNWVSHDKFGVVSLRKHNKSFGMLCKITGGLNENEHLRTWKKPRTWPTMTFLTI